MNSTAKTRADRGSSPREREQVRPPKQAVRTGRKQDASAFSARIARDPRSETPVVTLAHAGTQKRPPLSVKIAPEKGANLLSLKVGDRELLAGQTEALAGGNMFGGTPVLYPTPNRVRKGVMSFGGKTYRFPINLDGNFIHGLVRAARFDFGPVEVGARKAQFSTWIQWDERQETFSQFPFRHRFQMTFTLTAKAVTMAFLVHNQGRERLPMGIGLHPWFVVPESKDAVHIQVPAAKVMQARKLLPTGRVRAVSGRLTHDLRTPRPLAGLALDDVYMGLKPSKPATITWKDWGIRLSLGADSAFGHMVVYTPDAPHFCLENQTCSTDAHNLYAAGKRKLSGLQIIQPGAPWKGRVNWTVESVGK